MAKQVETVHIDYQGKAAKALAKRSEKTPDYHQLRFYNRIPVFVYGNYQPGGVNNYLLRASPYLGEAHTLIPAFQMKIGPYGTPVVFQKKVHDENTFYIKGDVYAVSPETILALDDWIDNTGKVQRRLARISLEEFNLPNGKYFRGLPYINAFMYLGREEYWDKENMRLQFSTRLQNKPNLRHMDFQYAPIVSNPNSHRLPSPHRGITDQLERTTTNEELRERVWSPDADFDANEDDLFAGYGHPYGGVPPRIH